MSGIYWSDGHAKLRKYSASTTSGKTGKSVIRCEIEIIDGYELGSILNQLVEIEAKQQAVAQPARSPARKQRRGEQAELPAPPLMIGYRGDDA